MKRIIISLSVIAVAAAVVVGATTAYFSDTETSHGNTISAGTIDIAVDGQNPWSEDYHFELDDMKPCYVKYSIFTVKNVATNPVRVWKHIKNVVTEDGVMSEPECTDGGGVWDNGQCETQNYTAKHNIDKVIEYDMYTCEGGKSVCETDNDGKPVGDNWNIVIHEDDGITLRDIKSHHVYLGELEKNKKLTVVQSYHMKSDTGNWAQGDTVTFDIELLALQLNATGPNKTTLLLENKDSNWDRILGDGRYGILTYKTENDTFDYDLVVKGLNPSTVYALVYAPDPWPQAVDSENTKIGTFTTDANGDLNFSGSIDLGYDIPHPDENNYPEGGKIWVVLDAHHNGYQMSGSWTPEEYLYEYNLVRYEDTND